MYVNTMGRKRYWKYDKNIVEIKESSKTLVNGDRVEPVYTPFLEGDTPALPAKRSNTPEQNTRDRIQGSSYGQMCQLTQQKAPIPRCSPNLPKEPERANSRYA